MLFQKVTMFKPHLLLSVLKPALQVRVFIFAGYE